MSLLGTTSQSAYPDEFSDTMANLTASVVQEQLTPILETLREHAKLLDLHAALLNHSTAMNRYNVGKLDDIRDFQSNINYKLQFYVDPEERAYPTYHNPPVFASVPAPRVEAAALLDVASLPPESVPDVDVSDEPAQSPADDPPTTPTTRAPESQDPPSPPATERAPSPPPSPQFTGEAFTLVPSSSRQLQRERPFSVQPDPMWNSTRSINPFLHLAAAPPPPPYVEPPAYAAEDPSQPTPAAESQAQAPTLIAELVSPPPSVPRPASEVEVEVAVSAGPSTSVTTVNAPRTPSPSPSPVVTISLSTASMSSPLVGEDDPDTGATTQLSEKARGKKRMREEDSSSESDEDGDDDPFVAGSSSSSSSGLGRDGSDCKRIKMDTRVNTDRLDLSPCGWETQRTSFMDKLYTLSDRRRNAEKLKSMERLYRGAL